MLTSAFRPVAVHVHLPIAARAVFLPVESNLTLAACRYFQGTKTLQQVCFRHRLQIGSCDEPTSNPPPVLPRPPGVTAAPASASAASNSAAPCLATTGWVGLPTIKQWL